MKFDHKEEKMKEMEIGKFFKEKVEMHDPTPAESVWKRIEKDSELIQYNRNRSASRKIKRTIVAGIIAVTTFVAVYFIHSTLQEPQLEKSEISLQFIDNSPEDNIAIPEDNMEKKTIISPENLKQVENGNVQIPQSESENPIIKIGEITSETNSEPAEDVNEEAITILPLPEMPTSKEPVSRQDLSSLSSIDYPALSEPEKETMSDSHPLEDIPEEPKPESFFIPNAFTPNADGLNDHFTLYPPTGISNFEISIFDRLSRRVYNSKSAEPGWDGQVNGQSAPNGSYIYLITYKDQNGKSHELKGSLTLIR